jgi:hypothetical protein
VVAILRTFPAAIFPRQDGAAQIEHESDGCSCGRPSGPHDRFYAQGGAGAGVFPKLLLSAMFSFTPYFACGYEDLFNGSLVHVRHADLVPRVAVHSIRSMKSVVAC